MRNVLFAAAVTIVFTLAFGAVAVRLLRRWGARQTVLGYVKEHFEKNGTPTVGGVIFVVPIILMFLLFKRGASSISFVCLSCGAAFAVVGFFDDFIKIKFRKNEGLTALQKIIFQFVIAVIISVFAVRTGLTEQFIPFTRERVDPGAFFIPLGTMVFLSTTNCVNLTDGLDGLAATVSAVYMLFAAALICLQSRLFGFNGTAGEEFDNAALLCVITAAALAGFLAFNTNSASVFMGDTGSLALGGLTGSVLMTTGNVFYIPILGITFVLSGVSVIIQVLHYKRTKKRIFLMAPLHHHFQHKGLKEAKIVFIYKIITIVAGLVVLTCYIGG